MSFSKLFLTVVVIPTFVVAGGCTHRALRSQTLQTASTLSELQYQMVLDNLAMLSSNPNLLPWHVKLDDGSVQVSDELHAEFRGGWVSEALMGEARLEPERQVTLQWDVVPVTDPKELRDLQAAYQKAMGMETGQDLLKELDIPTGWFESGRSEDVPSNASHIGRYREHCVWVLPDQIDGLSKFTLSVLAIVKLDADERSFDRGIISTPR